MPPRPRPEANVDYTLPATIQSIQNGWQLTCHVASLLSGLLSVVSVLLFMVVHSASVGSTIQVDGELGSSTYLALSVFAYAALVLNIGASLSSFILIDELGELPFRAAQQRSSLLPSRGPIEGSPAQLLRRYGADRLWTFIAYHWMVSAALGLISLLAEISLYVWMQEPKVVKIVTTSLVGFALLPILLVLFVPCLSRDTRYPRNAPRSQRSSAAQPQTTHYSNTSPIDSRARRGSGLSGGSRDTGPWAQ
ncbi:hypothetical protein DFP72DRAFT_913037 [Ephemerocybe angulata]|uniref:Uncharacterized protein n=1 Tax=Ephemerocybe angulata TaxID=980116 RepID=A0A8H6M0A6_9AGAR|nr:hypothetical protein DFP72DRAFT_913037 [Tulosesus angulatus]